MEAENTTQTHIPGVCLDSNIFVRFLAPDERGPDIEFFFATLHRHSPVIYCPALASFEIAKAVGKKEKMHLLSDVAAGEALRNYFQMPVLLVWDLKLLESALDVHRRGIKSFYDASFLALAMIRNIPLITEDGDFAARGRKFHPKIFSIAEWLER